MRGKLLWAAGFVSLAVLLGGCGGDAANPDNMASEAGSAVIVSEIRQEGRYEQDKQLFIAYYKNVIKGQTDVTVSDGNFRLLGSVDGGSVRIYRARPDGAAFDDALYSVELGGYQFTNTQTEYPSGCGIYALSGGSFSTLEDAYQKGILRDIKAVYGFVYPNGQSGAASGGSSSASSKASGGTASKPQTAEYKSGFYRVSFTTDSIDMPYIAEQLIKKALEAEKSGDVPDAYRISGYAVSSVQYYSGDIGGFTVTAIYDVTPVNPDRYGIAGGRTEDGEVFDIFRYVSVKRSGKTYTVSDCRAGIANE